MPSRGAPSTSRRGWPPSSSTPTICFFEVPLYNFGVSQHFKAWVDLVVTDPRMASCAGQPLAGRPAVLVVVRGARTGLVRRAKDGVTLRGGCAASSETCGVSTERWSTPNSRLSS